MIFFSSILLLFDTSKFSFFSSPSFFHLLLDCSYLFLTLSILLFFDILSFPPQPHIPPSCIFSSFAFCFSLTYPFCSFVLLQPFSFLLYLHTLLYFLFLFTTLSHQWLLLNHYFFLILESSLARSILPQFITSKINSFSTASSCCSSSRWTPPLLFYLIRTVNSKVNTQEHNLSVKTLLSIGATNSNHKRSDLLA